MATSIPPQPSDDELSQLEAFAEAVGCTVAYAPDPNYEAPWLVTSPIGPRRYGPFIAAQWAVQAEMDICYRLGLIRDALEPVLADSSHWMHQAVLAWWRRADGTADDLNLALRCEATKFATVLGSDLIAACAPKQWTLEQLNALTPRGDATRSAYAFMQHARALRAAAELEGMLSPTTTPIPPLGPKLPAVTLKQRKRL